MYFIIIRFTELRPLEFLFTKLYYSKSFVTGVDIFLNCSFYPFVHRILEYRERCLFMLFTFSKFSFFVKRGLLKIHSKQPHMPVYMCFEKKISQHPSWHHIDFVWERQPKLHQCFTLMLHGSKNYHSGSHESF